MPFGLHASHRTASAGHGKGPHETGGRTVQLRHGNTGGSRILPLAFTEPDYTRSLLIDAINSLLLSHENVYCRPPTKEYVFWRRI